MHDYAKSRRGAPWSPVGCIVHAEAKGLSHPHHEKQRVLPPDTDEWVDYED